MLVEKIPKTSSNKKLTLNNSFKKKSYFKTGAPEPYEFLIIKKTVGKKPGKMMKDYIEKHNIKTENKILINDK